MKRLFALIALILFAFTLTACLRPAPNRYHGPAAPKDLPPPTHIYDHQ